MLIQERLRLRPQCTPQLGDIFLIHGCRVIHGYRLILCASPRSPSHVNTVFSMRLLNTITLQLEEVADSELTEAHNQYAILSHRWGSDEDEVSYHDMISHENIGSKKGYIKIKEFFNIAARSGYRYGWCDTCCINKGNSSELAESINSMYMWYKMSTLCVVYLSDVPAVDLEDSEWFDRGWTLQELIAPKAVSFFDCDWHLLGTKLDLLEALSKKTGVPSDVLSNRAEPWACSVAQRMSWAAHRITRRVEDRAYSLLGLFEVNMPMIYGEREKAFLRLQQNIAQKSKDESLFAWGVEPSTVDSQDYFSIFASSPSAFSDCRNIIPTLGSSGFTQNNGELAITLRVCRRTPGIFTAFLHCTEQDDKEKRFFIRISKTFEEESYVRVRGIEATQGLSSEGSSEERLIRFVIEPKTPPVRIMNGFWLRTIQPPGHDVSDISIVSCSPPLDSGYIQCTTLSQYGVVRLQSKAEAVSPSPSWSKIEWLRFWFNKELGPVVWIGNNTQTGKLQAPFEQLLACEQADVEARTKILESFGESIWVTPEGKKVTAIDTCDVGHDWPHGNAFIPVDRKTGLHDFVLPNLQMQISVRLLPCRSPKLKGLRASDKSASSRNTTLVWVVDITSVNVTRVHPSAQLKTDWCRWSLNAVCFCCVLNCQDPCTLGGLLVCCWLRCKEYPSVKSRYNLTCYDWLYPCCKGRWLRNKEAKAKKRYTQGARSEVPMLFPDGNTAYAVTTIRPMYDCPGVCWKKHDER